MEFLRYIFLISIITGCTSAGFLISKGYRDRVKELKILSNLINILQNKIKFTHKPLQEVLEEVANIKVSTRVPHIFSLAAEKMQNERFEDAWNESISKVKLFVNLTNEDLELVRTLGTVLGKTNIEGQMSELNQFNVLLKEQIKKAEQEQSKNEKMYKSLGTIVGLAIVIILF